MKTHNLHQKNRAHDRAQQGDPHREAAALKREVYRLRVLITQAARRAEALGLSYDEFDALIAEANKQPLQKAHDGSAFTLKVERDQETATKYFGR